MKGRRIGIFSGGDGEVGRHIVLPERTELHNEMLTLRSQRVLSGIAVLSDISNGHEQQNAVIDGGLRHVRNSQGRCVEPMHILKYSDLWDPRRCTDK